VPSGGTLLSSQRIKEFGARRLRGKRKNLLNREGYQSRSYAAMASRETTLSGLGNKGGKTSSLIWGEGKNSNTETSITKEGGKGRSFRELKGGEFH